MKPAQGHVFVAGSANLDFVVRAAHVPAPGETVPLLKPLNWIQAALGSWARCAVRPHVEPEPLTSAMRSPITAAPEHGFDAPPLHVSVPEKNESETVDSGLS